VRIEPTTMRACDTGAYEARGTWARPGAAADDQEVRPADDGRDDRAHRECALDKRVAWVRDLLDRVTVDGREERAVAIWTTATDDGVNRSDAV